MTVSPSAKPFTSLTKAAILFVWALSILNTKAEIPQPHEVLILANKNVPESIKLAKYYAVQRAIPSENILELDVPNKETISRDTYDADIRDPLRHHLRDNRLWTLRAVGGKMRAPTRNKIRLIVTTFGMPYRISQKNPPAPAGEERPKVQPGMVNHAAVDSELACAAIHELPIDGPTRNPYHKANTSFKNHPESTPFFLVGRIDGPNYKTAKRLIDDAIATEKQGLWGFCYLDKSLKSGAYKQGDNWLDHIEKANWERGIPSITDANRQTYLNHYPMRDVALYYGWYTTHVNGPFKDPEFQFKRGAVAIHLHSFSAAKFRDPNTHWVGPLLARGAAATVGNVFEPYLATTHHFDILQQALLDGHCFAEACAMALPILSWQNMSVGDPLYRPFLRIDASGVVKDEDKAFRAINLAFRAWQGDDEKIKQKLTTAAIKSNDARYYETLGLWSQYLGLNNEALSYYQFADKKYSFNSDKVRIALHNANLFRKQKNKKAALIVLRDALIGREKHTSGIPLKSMIDILDPPPPPPATPREDS
ncbi:TIGR03790 family protein [Rubritalea marina]|uniref:TIGR03790 family protein n=1 Tax=Rubritalea marina TaxID=361055 RepID=UPI00036874B8|nr:TIGR03790 family protein [Rubritalea marina]